MARKRVADIAAEEQAQYEEAQRRAAIAVEEEPEPEPESPTTQPAMPEQIEPAPEIDPETDSDLDDPDLIHREHTHRTIRRDFTFQERMVYEKQLTRAVLKLAKLKKDKSDSVKRANEKIAAQQDEAITAAERLQEGAESRSVKVECIWDLPMRTYKEVAEDTREVVLRREMTLQEIERFQQQNLPGFGRPVGSWLNAAEAVAAAKDPVPDEEPDAEDFPDDDDDLDDVEDLDDEDEADA